MIQKVDKSNGQLLTVEKKQDTNVELWSSRN